MVLSAIVLDSLNSSSYMIEALRANLGRKTPKILIGSSVRSSNEKLINSFADYQVETLSKLNDKIDEIEREMLKIV